MSATRTATHTFFRLELADALRSRWVLFTGGCYLVVFGLFVWFGLRESTVLGFTGISRVILNVSNAIILVLPLVALVSTCQAIVRGRSSGFCELFLSQPCRRTDWLGGLLLTRLVVIIGPLVVFLLAVWIWGAVLKERSVAPLAIRTLLVATTLTWAFLGFGVLLSALARSAERALLGAIVTWLLAAAFHDFALIAILLQVRLAPEVVFTLAAANPTEAARLAILSGIDPELSVLGPVGFWLANYLGPARTLAVGILWPAAIGTASILLAGRTLNRIDLAG